MELFLSPMWALFGALCVGVVAVGTVRRPAPDYRAKPRPKPAAWHPRWLVQRLWLAVQVASYYVLFRGLVPLLALAVRWLRYRGANLPPQARRLSFQEFREFFPFRMHLMSLKLHRDTGAIWSTYNPGVGLLIMVADPKAVEKVLRDKKTFQSRAATGFQSFVPRGLLALPTGPEWLFHRRLLSNVFTDTALRRYADSIQAEVARMLVKWRGHLVPAPADGLQSLSTTSESKTTSSSSSVQGNQEVNAQADLVALTFDIIGRIGFGAIFNAQEDPSHPVLQASGVILDETLRRTTQPKPAWLLPPGRRQRFDKAVQLVRAEVAKTIEEKFSSNRQRASDELENAQGSVAVEKNMCYLMQEARIADSKGSGNGKQNKLSMEDIYQESITLMGAGHETTSNTLSWSLLLLAQHPEAQQKLYEEVAKLKGSTATFDEAKKLSFTRMVIYETLRLYPTVPFFPRLASKDTEIAGYTIPAGSRVFVSQMHMNRNPELWDEPLNFMPERFEGHTADPSPSRPVGVPGKQQPYGFVPFGAGPRTCIGQRLAMLEAVIILSSIVRNFHLELADVHKTRGVDQHCDITLGPKAGLYLSVTPRSHQE